MKYGKNAFKGNETKFYLKIKEKKVPFNKEGEQLMYQLTPVRGSVISFEDIAHDSICKMGINGHVAVALAGMMSDSICRWIDSGHAVNIANVGTLKPVIKCKAHLNPNDCSVEDVKSVKMQFFPCKEINEVLGKVSFRVKNRSEFLDWWKRCRKK